MTFWLVRYLLDNRSWKDMETGHKWSWNITLECSVCRLAA